MKPHMPQHSPPTSLRRELGVGGAVLLGLGSMLGSGVFVALGLAAGLASPGHNIMGILMAISAAGLLALCNGLSAAQLAGVFPASGGTYEYAHKVGWPAAGAAAGTLFLVAKSASAATAALGLAGYLLEYFNAPQLAVPGALAMIAMAAVITLEGIRRSNRANTVLVGITLAGLALFVFAILRENSQTITSNGVTSPPSTSVSNGLKATALLFVAFTGYGRVATLGEEVQNPRQTVPKAVVITVLLCLVIYTGVAIAAIGAVGGETFAQFSRTGRGPLEAVAAAIQLSPAVGVGTAIAAIAALFGVILNLLLGLSRVLLAMGRRGHLPKRFAQIDASGQSPVAAVLLATGLVAGLAAMG
ncbi:MAG: APC family permease, partial [Algisphaera sp.]